MGEPLRETIGQIRRQTRVGTETLGSNDIGPLLYLPTPPYNNLDLWNPAEAPSHNKMSLQQNHHGGPLELMR